MFLSFVWIITFLLILVSTGEVGMNEASGKDFLDNFFYYNADIWEMDNDYLICISLECTYILKNRLRYVHVDDTYAHTYLQLTLKRDCYGPYCCAEDRCTEYTGGQITSKHSYSYGTFEFLAATSSDYGNIDDQVAAWSCFSLETANAFDAEDEEDMMRGLSICVPSLDPWKAVILLQRGDHLLVRHINLTFNASKSVALYKIDWHPNYVKFYINGRLVANVDGKKSKSVPDMPLHIKVSLFPRLPADVEKVMNLKYARESENGTRSAIRTHLFRARYQKLTSFHDELLVLGNPPFLVLKYCIVALLIFLVMFILFFIRRATLKQLKSSMFESFRHGSYSLLTEENAKPP